MTGASKSLRMKAAAVVVGALAGSLAVAAAAQDAERAPVFRASELLPPELRAGTGWTVDETVGNDGFINHYTVRVGEATLSVDSTDLLRIRAHELEMLAKMEEIKRSGIYLDAVGKAATSPLRFVKDLVSAPGDTVQGTVEGVGQLFGNIGHSLFGKPSTQEEGAAKAVLGVGVAKRKFAEKFAVDPYSSNEPMQARLGELAWAATAGSMTVGGAFGAIGGPASGVLRATKFAGGAGTLIYDKSPDQLKNINRANLAHMGMSPELTAAFLDHPKYSPTRKTIIVAVIGRMNGISNRRLLLQDAVTATAEPDTFLWQRQVELIAGYHLKVGPVDRLVNLGIRPAMVTKTGTLIVAVPSDYFAWTETMEREAQEIRGSVGKSLTGIKRREAWFSGQISPFARAKLEARGWIVKDNTAVRLAL